MSKFRIVNLIDKVFVSVSVFLIIYAWINFFIRDLYVTFILSLIFSFACVFLLYYFLNKKNTNTMRNKKRLQDIDETFLAFRLLSKQEKFKFLKNLLSLEHEVVLHNDMLVYKKYGNQILLIVATHIEKINQNDLINLIDEHVQSDIKNIEIICNDFMPNLKLNIIKDKQIKLISKTSLYDDFFLKYNLFPDRSNINLKSTKLTLKDVAKNFFLPHKSKSYFLCGLILIFSAIILPYHLYYLIFGSVLLMFSIVCKILPNFKR